MEDTPAPELRVDMISTDSASFNGEVLTHRIPAPAWAGRLVGLGYDPATIMDVYRNGTLETRISLGVAARFAPADEAPTTVDTPPRPPDDGSPTTEWSDRSPELALEVQAGVVAAGGASISDPALEPTPEPERVRAPLPPPADDPASPLPVVSGPLVHVELLYQAGTVVLDLPIDHVNPRLEACRQLVILGHADCFAKIDTQTFEPGFSYWADLIVDEGTTSFKRRILRTG